MTVQMALSENFSFYGSPVNFLSLLPTRSNYFIRHSRNFSDLFPGSFKELPTGMIGRWFPKATKNQSEPTLVSTTKVILVCSVSLKFLEWHITTGCHLLRVSKQMHVHFSRSKKFTKKSSELSLSSRA